MTEQLAIFDAGPFELHDAAHDPVCLDCSTDTIALDEYYMLRNEVWLQANPADAGMLCIGCVEARLGRRLIPVDFTAAQCNSWLKSDRLFERMGRAA